MLHELSIRNFAIVDDLNLGFAAGMTVLSGETGAGKSILVDALGLLLGDRADSGAVRDGEARAEIGAVFSLADAGAARAWLTERDLDDGDDCVLRRVIARAGRSRNWINASPVTTRDLKDLGEFLVDIHGQHAHQTLLRSARQRDLLDEQGQCLPARAALAQTLSRLRSTEKEIAALEGTGEAGRSRLELLHYQVDELRALALGANELPELEAEHRRLANAERLIADGRQALGLLFEADSGAASDLLAQSARLLGELADLDSAFAQAAELADSAHIQTQEAADGVRRTLDGLELDPQRLAAVERRLAAIQELARKHRCAPAELPGKTAELGAKLQALEGADERLTGLHTERATLRTRYRKQARTLHSKRAAAAAELSTRITAGIRELGMPQGVFEVQVQFADDAAPSPYGADRVAFLVSANPGEAVRPLERVAAGGELSRISLAIQVAAVTATPVPTLVFDEVDAGIGGGVAEIVGRQLRRLGARGQALCVTHLPQVAAQAQQHLHVAKEVNGGRTRTRIAPLAAKRRVEELARMLGGLDITERTRAHAQEMIERAG